MATATGAVLSLRFNLTKRSFNPDADGDSTPDNCQRDFRRGDSSGEGTVDMADVLHVLDFIFRKGPTPPCVEAANFNDDGSINVTDPVFLLNYLFQGGAPPASPGPADCGRDPADSTNNLGCRSYESC